MGGEIVCGPLTRRPSVCPSFCPAGRLLRDVGPDVRAAALDRSGAGGRGARKPAGGRPNPAEQHVVRTHSHTPGDQELQAPSASVN